MTWHCRHLSISAMLHSCLAWAPLLVATARQLAAAAQACQQLWGPAQLQ